MDSNETLRQLRETITAWRQAKNGADKIRAGAQIVELIEALDGWLSAGGFAPADWIADPNTRGPIETPDYATWERILTSNVLAFAPNAISYTVGVAEWDNGYWYDQYHVTATLPDGRHATIAFDENDEAADAHDALAALSERDGPLGRHSELTVNINKED